MQRTFWSPKLGPPQALSPCPTTLWGTSLMGALKISATEPRAIPTFINFEILVVISFRFPVSGFRFSIFVAAFEKLKSKFLSWSFLTQWPISFFPKHFFNFDVSKRKLNWAKTRIQTFPHKNFYCSLSTALNHLLLASKERDTGSYGSAVITE